MTDGVGPLDILYLLPYIASAAMSGIIVILAGRRFESPLVRSFVGVLWMESIWIALLVCELLARSLGAKIFWDNLQFPVSLGTPVALFLFALRATGTGREKTGRYRPLFLPAVVSAVLAFTDPLHGLVRSAPRLDVSVPFGELVYGFTLSDYLLFAYSYGLSVAAIALLIRSYFRVDRSVRRKYALVIIAFLLPTAGILPTMFDFRIGGRRDLSPLWFALGNPLIFLAFFRFHLFDLVPIAKRILVESMGDPLVIYDSDGLLLDCNRAFSEKILGVPGSGRKLKGRRLPELLSPLPELARAILESDGPTREGEGSGSSLKLASPAGVRDYRVAINVIPTGNGESPAELYKVALFRDVTELASVEKQLQSWNAELEGKISARIADLEREVARRRAAEAGLRKVSAQIIRSQREILVTLSEVVENRSPETANHVLRVGEYSRILATALGLTADGVALIANAAPLHDVGKIAVPDSILSKNGPLSSDEMAVMKTHTSVGYRILESSGRSIIRAAAIIALEHHERWNGEGYPAGKAGEAISLSGRIVCLCDVYDALATTRSYKQPWETAKILEYVRNESGRMFDPRLVEILLSMPENFREVAKRFPEAPSAFTLSGS